MVFFDLLTALPFNLLYYYFCKYYQNQNFHIYENNNIIYYLLILKYLKSIKIFKMSVNNFQRGNEDRNYSTNFVSPQGNQNDQTQEDENKFTFKGKFISIKIKFSCDNRKY